MLNGKRILITRTPEQSSALRSKFEAAGAEVLAVPAIEIAPPKSYEPLDTALAHLEEFDWLVLTSANAVQVVAARAATLSLPGDSFLTLKIAAIGEATAQTVRDAGWLVTLLPEKAVAESLAAALGPEVAGKRVLIARAAVARDVLPEALDAAGASVTIVDTYTTVRPKGSAALLAKILRSSRVPDAAVFTSASSVHNLMALANEAGVTLPATVRMITIGPITSAALAEHGERADAEASEASLDALVQATIQAFARPDQ